MRRCCSVRSGATFCGRNCGNQCDEPSCTASKVIRSVEEKGLRRCDSGEQDKRKMYFELTAAGKKCLAGMKCGSVAVPEIPLPVLRARCDDRE
ncbi:MAG: winged helix DNA-binding protein [Alistipes indistinctus]